MPIWRNDLMSRCISEQSKLLCHEPFCLIRAIRVIRVKACSHNDLCRTNFDYGELAFCIIMSVRRAVTGRSPATAFMEERTASVVTTLRQLAELVKGQLHGDAELAIQSARTLGEAQPGDITFVE